MDHKQTTSEIKVCCKNCQCRSHIWCIYNPYRWFEEKELEEERECEKFNPTLSAIAEVTDGELYFVIRE